MSDERPFCAARLQACHPEPWKNRRTGWAVDPECPEVAAFCKPINEAVAAAEDQFATLRVQADALEAFELQHQRTCQRCESYVLEGTDDGRSAIWGATTLGLILGLLIGFFTKNYWQTVVVGAIVGGAFGIGTELLVKATSKR